MVYCYNPREMFVAQQPTALLTHQLMLLCISSLDRAPTALPRWQLLPPSTMETISAAWWQLLCAASPRARRTTKLSTWLTVRPGSLLACEMLSPASTHPCNAHCRPPSSTNTQCLLSMQRVAVRPLFVPSYLPAVVAPVSILTPSSTCCLPPPHRHDC
jgi:hypothetical protein